MFEEIKAPVTGLICQYHVSLGSDVKPNDIIVGMESMKMEIAVACTTKGVVSYLAPLYELVEEGQVIARIDQQ